MNINSKYYEGDEQVEIAGYSDDVEWAEEFFVLNAEDKRNDEFHESPEDIRLWLEKEEMREEKEFIYDLVFVPRVLEYLADEMYQKHPELHKKLKNKNFGVFIVSEWESALEFIFMVIEKYQESQKEKEIV